MKKKIAMKFWRRLIIRSNKSILWFCFFALIIIQSGCKTGRIFTETDAGIKKYSSNDLINKIVTGKDSNDYYSIRFNAKVKFLNKKNTLNGMIRIKRDSIVWISLGPAVGIEMLRLVALKDSVMFVNKANNTFYNGDYDFLKKLLQLDINYGMLQSILLNEIFIYNSVGTFYEELKFISYDSNYYVLRNFKEKLADYLKAGNENQYMQKITIDPYTFRIVKMSINDRKVNRNLNLEYTNFKKIEKRELPEEIHFYFNNIDNLLHVTINYQKITTDKDLKFPFKVNKKFTPYDE